jgi:hypothetical protein
MVELVARLLAKYVAFKIHKNDHGCDWYRLWHNE